LFAGEDRPPSEPPPLGVNAFRKPDATCQGRNLICKSRKKANLSFGDRNGGTWGKIVSRRGRAEQGRASAGELRKGDIPSRRKNGLGPVPAKGLRQPRRERKAVVVF